MIEEFMAKHDELTEGMSLLAWRPWKDALDACNLLSSFDSPGEQKNWRLYWLAGVASLRAIGHVMDKVDSKKSLDHKNVIAAWWLGVKKNKPLVFSEFIEPERNNILKLYEFGAEPSPVTSYTMNDRGLSYAELVKKYGERHILIWGPDGENGIEVMARAVVWWDEELRVIEEAILEKLDCDSIQNLGTRDKLLDRSLRKRPWHSELPSWA